MFQGLGWERGTGHTWLWWQERACEGVGELWVCEDEWGLVNHATVLEIIPRTMGRRALNWGMVNATLCALWDCGRGKSCDSEDHQDEGLGALFLCSANCLFLREIAFFHFGVKTEILPWSCKPTACTEAEAADQPGMARDRTSDGQGCLLQELHRAPLGRLVHGKCSGPSKDGKSLSWAWKSHKNTKTQASAPKAEAFLTT